MTTPTIYTATQEEVRSGTLGLKLRQFNYGFVGEYPQSQPVWLSAKDGDGALAGGLRGFVFLGWLNIDVLFVEEAARRQGLGARLLQEAERMARDMGARGAKLETFEWQAAAFYRKQGYEEFARINDFVKSFHLSMMKKAL